MGPSFYPTRKRKSLAARIFISPISLTHIHTGVEWRVMMINDENTPMPATEAYFDLISAIKKGETRPVLKAKRALKPKTPKATARTSSSSPIPAEITFADDIYEEAFFRDFEHFTKVRKTFQKNTHTEYRTDSSSKMNDLYPQEIREKYGYTSVVYTCIHGKERTRSTGKRSPKQSLALGCKSRIRLLFNAATKTFKISVFNSKHNHVCAPPQYDQKKRRIRPELLPETDCEESPVKRPKLDLPTTPTSTARTPLAPINRMPKPTVTPKVEPETSGSSSDQGTSTDSVNSEQSDESMKKSEMEVLADELLSLFLQIINPDIEEGAKTKLLGELDVLIEKVRSVEDENSAECVRQLEIFRSAC